MKKTCFYQTQFTFYLQNIYNKIRYPARTKTFEKYIGKASIKKCCKFPKPKIDMPKLILFLFVKKNKIISVSLLLWPPFEDFYLFVAFLYSQTIFFHKFQVPTPLQFSLRKKSIHILTKIKIKCKLHFSSNNFDFI